MSLFDQEISVRHPTSDRKLTPEGEWETEYRETTVTGWYETRSSTREVAASDQITSGYWLYLPESEEFTDKSQALINGGWHSVDGRAQTQPGGVLLGGYKPIALTITTG